MTANHSTVLYRNMKAVPPMIVRGEGISGLARAFMFAGSPTVLASLWEVNDRSAVQLMRNFYGHLRDSDKATALAQAQREMQARGLYRHPYYWGAFTLVGRMK